MLSSGINPLDETQDEQRRLYWGRSEEGRALRMRAEEGSAAEKRTRDASDRRDVKSAPSSESQADTDKEEAIPSSVQVPAQTTGTDIDMVLPGDLARPDETQDEQRRLYWGRSEEGRALRMRAEERLAAEERRKKERRFFRECVISVAFFLVFATASAVAALNSEIRSDPRAVHLLLANSLISLILAGNSLMWALILKRRPQLWPGRTFTYGDFFSGYIVWFRNRQQLAKKGVSSQSEEKDLL